MPPKIYVYYIERPSVFFFPYIHLIMIGEEILVLHLVCLNILLEEKGSYILLCSMQG